MTASTNVVAEQVFPITTTGVRVSVLIERGQYTTVDSRIREYMFPINLLAPRDRVIELVEFSYNPTLKEVLTKFERQGLERLTLEDTLTCGAQYPDVQRKQPVIFLHEPVLICNLRYFLLLYEYDGKRHLRLVRWSDSNGWWSKDYAFAAVRK